jgi:adenylate cyclase
MDADDIHGIAHWVVAQGLAGSPEDDLLRTFSERCRAAGLPLCRGIMIIDTLHPVHEGRAFLWRSDGADERTSIDYGRTNQGEAAEAWRRSPFYRLLQSGGDEMRIRLDRGLPGDVRSNNLERLMAEGQTDYIAFVHRMAGEAAVGRPIGEMDCVYSQWSTDRPGGFSDAHLAALRQLVPPLGLAIKSAALARVVATLAEVYLGRDAAQRVLEGRIMRGVAERIRAVLWFSDLRGYTAITDTAAPDVIIPLLNDYAEAVITSIHEADGDVLKLMGDGTLAMFRGDDTAEACRRALTTEASVRAKITALNARRSEAGLPVTSVYVGLHIGEVHYGNIGSDDRLDFTVVGPAVNEVSRIASMCRSVDRSLLVSSEFHAATPERDRAALVCVGRFALRGVGRAQELFTLDPALA